MSQNFQLTNVINRGTYGEIYNMEDQTLVYKSYLNCYKSRNFDDNFIDPSILRELSILKYLNHTDIIKLIDINFYKIHHQIGLGFTMKKYNSSLFDLIPNLTDDNIKNILFSLLKIINYCHSNYIIHRDLKPGNILIEYDKDKKEYNPILIDFGLSKFDFFYDDYTNFFKIPIQFRNENIQTLWYRAPEVILNKTQNYKMDIWSLGIIFLDMIMKKNGCISAKDTDKQLKEYIKNVDNGDNDINQLKKKFGLEEWNLSVYDEINFDKDGIDLLKKMLNFNPNHRIRCQDALNHDYFKDLPKDMQSNLFFNNANNFNILKINLIDFPKVVYDRKYIINLLDNAQINAIIIEWVIYITDYYMISNNENFPYSCISIEDFAIFATYLYLKFLHGETLTFLGVGKKIFGRNYHNYKVIALKEMEFDIFRRINYNLIIKTPGLILYKFFTLLYRDNIINLEQLGNTLNILSNSIKNYLVEKSYYVFEIEEIIDAIGKKILDLTKINVPDNYLKLIKSKQEDNISYSYFFNKLN